MGRSGEHVERIVISGPNGDGQWFWRLVDGDETRPVPPDLVDPDWRAGHIVEWRVRGTELIGPPAPPEAPLVTLDGQPLDLPDTIDLEPGVVITADIPFSGADPGHPGRTAKRRPVVVTQIHPTHLVVRALYSTNNEGRGHRLRHPETTGARNQNSVVADDETLVPLADAGDAIGRLDAVDLQRVLGR